MPTKNELWNKIALEWIDEINDKISLVLPRILKSTWEIKKWEVILHWINAYHKFTKYDLNIERIVKHDFIWKPSSFWNARFTDKETLKAKKDIHKWEIIIITDDERRKPIFRAPNMFIYNLLQFVLCILILVVVWFVAALISR